MMRSAYFYLVLSFFLLMASPLFSDCAQPSKLVLVSVAPHADLVKRIAGDTVTIELLVPAGTSMHVYEPTPKQILKVSKADLWFGIGESFEQKLFQALQQQNRCLRFVDLRESVTLIYCDATSKHGHCHCCVKGGADLHIWLSPKQVIPQVKQIAQVLSARYPEHQALYEKNLKILLQQLQTLDQELTQLFASSSSKTFMVSHAAYAYLARDYGLKQLPIEYEGREPSPKQLTDLMQQARHADVQVIFTQPQYPDKAAKLIANALNIRVLSLDPYSPDYFTSMLEIGKAISGKYRP